MHLVLTFRTKKEKLKSNQKNSILSAFCRLCVGYLFVTPKNLHAFAGFYKNIYEKKG